MTETQTLIIGDGWAATALAGFLASEGKSILWISGTGAHVQAPVSFQAAGHGTEILLKLARILEIPIDESQTGSFLREQRKQAFREPNWVHAPTPDDRLDVYRETLWEAEYRIGGLFEASWPQASVMDLEEEIRKRVLALPQITRVEGKTLVAVDGAAHTVKLSTGEQLAYGRLFYADRWSVLREADGLPKTIETALKKAHAFCTLQLGLEHSKPMAQGVRESFMLEVTRESAESQQRRVWGGFYADARKSRWTMMLSSDEGEDNHEIAKRLRRIKQSLNRAFAGPEWIGDSKEFMLTVSNETVRFEQEGFFSGLPGTSAGAPLEWADGQMSVLADGFGFSLAFEQVGIALGLIPRPTRATAQSESEQLSRAGQA